LTELKSVEKIEIKETYTEPSVVIGIPAFNEERTIAKVVLQARKITDEVVVCDDGSSDMTAEIAENLGATVVKHEYNLGYGAAIQSLFKEAKKLNADVLVTFDGDDQHHIDDIPKLLKPIFDGEADVVTGSRFVGGKMNGDKHIPKIRRWGIRAITKLTNMASKQNMSDAQNGMRAYNKGAIVGLTLNENGMGVSVEILVKAREVGLKFMEVPIACNYDTAENHSTHNSLRHGTSVIMSLVRLIVEKHPLMFLGVPGALSTFVGLVFGLWLLQIYTIEHRIVTNVALASVSFILIGLFAMFTAITLYAITRLSQRSET
jgi:glycosyltransferase involved in cell wall biosynthesis